MRRWMILVAVAILGVVTGWLGKGLAPKYWSVFTSAYAAALTPTPPPKKAAPVSARRTRSVANETPRSYPAGDITILCKGECTVYASDGHRLLTVDMEP